MIFFLHVTPGGGKTHLVKHLMNELFDVWSDGAVFWLTTSLSWKSNKQDMHGIIDEKCVFLKEQYPDLKLLLRRVMKTVEGHRARKMSSLIVVDDLMGDLYKGNMGQELIDLMTQGRHAFATVWLLTQGLLKGGALGPVLRQNFRATIVLSSEYNNKLGDYCDAPAGFEQVLAEMFQACVFVDGKLFKYKAPFSVVCKGLLGDSEFRGVLAEIETPQTGRGRGGGRGRGRGGGRGRASVSTTPEPEQIVITDTPECGICKEEITADLFTSQCNHQFHRDCWDDYISDPNNENRCPLCGTLRYDIDQGDDDDSDNDNDDNDNFDDGDDMDELPDPPDNNPEDSDAEIRRRLDNLKRGGDDDTGPARQRFRIADGGFYGGPKTTEEVQEDDRRRARELQHERHLRFRDARERRIQEAISRNDSRKLTESRRKFTARKIANKMVDRIIQDSLADMGIDSMDNDNVDELKVVKIVNKMVDEIIMDVFIRIQYTKVMKELMEYHEAEVIRKGREDFIAFRKMLHSEDRTENSDDDNEARSELATNQ